MISQALECGTKDGMTRTWATGGRRYGCVNETLQSPIRVLHVEFGGYYGGSLKALENVLEYLPRDQFQHDLALCYPTPNLDNIRTMVARVLVLYPLKNGGTLLANALSRTRPGSGHQTWLRHRRLREGTSKFIASFPSLGRVRGLIIMLSHVGTVLKLRRIILDNNYDLLHVNNTFNLCPAFIWAGRLAHRPIVAHVRNSVRPRRFSRRLAASTTTLVTDTQRLADELAAGGVHTPIRVIHNGVMLHAPSVATAQGKYERIAGRDELLLVSVGRLTEQKGYEFLLRALSLVFERCTNVRLIIIGDGPLRIQLEQLAADLKLSPHLCFAGFRNDYRAIIAECDVYICSSLWEGLPLTVLDAMALGKPVISTDAGAIADYIRNDTMGRTVPIANAEALARAIIQMAELSPEARSTIGAAGRLAVQPLSDMASIARDFAKVMTEAVKLPLA